MRRAGRSGRAMAADTGGRESRDRLERLGSAGRRRSGRLGGGEGGHC